MTIRIAGLSDCKFCKSLRKKLQDKGINHTFFDCDKNSENCASLEALTNSDYYPMVLIQDEHENILEVYFFTQNYETMIKGSYTQNGIRLIPSHSTDSMAKYIENRLNLKL